MRPQALSCAGLAVALVLCQVSFLWAQSRLLLPPVVEQDGVPKDPPRQPEKGKKEKDKKEPEKKPSEPVAPGAFTPLARTPFPTLFTPNMMGDYGAIYAGQTRAVMGTQTTTTTTGLAPSTTVTTPTTQNRPVIASISTRGSFNIADDESPMPGDRVYVSWNNFSSIGFPQIGPNAPITTTTTRTTQTIPVRGALAPPVTTTTITTTTIPGAARVTLNRETFGFEKTFLDGNASIEIRAPLLQQGDGNAGLGADDVGDLTVIAKYALLLDRTTGNVFSVGLAVTAPSSRAIPTSDGNFQDTLIQPFIGYIWNFDRFYFQAFHSIAVPTNASDVTIAFNDVGVGYWLYRGNPDRPLRYIVPTIETHVITPLNHRNDLGPIVVPDTVSFTGGVHLGLFRNADLAVGVGVPVTGPTPYSIEAFVQLNWRF